MIDQETAEKMYIEQNEAMLVNLKANTEIAKRDTYRLILQTLEVVGIVAISIFLWR